ncbi:MAG: hypothetical protein R2695_13830 [Acidimicrobiales bacterium]
MSGSRTGARPDPIRSALSSAQKSSRRCWKPTTSTRASVLRPAEPVGGEGHLGQGAVGHLGGGERQHLHHVVVEHGAPERVGVDRVERCAGRLDRSLLEVAEIGQHPFHRVAQQCEGAEPAAEQLGRAQREVPGDEPDLFTAHGPAPTEMVDVDRGGRRIPVAGAGIGRHLVERVPEALPDRRAPGLLEMEEEVAGLHDRGITSPGGGSRRG